MRSIQKNLIIVVSVSIAVAAVGGCGVHEPPDTVYEAGSDVLAAVVEIDPGNCEANPPEREIWYEPSDPTTQPTSVIWKVMRDEKDRAERTVEIVAKPAQDQDPDDLERATAIRGLFDEQTKFTVPPGQNNVASGPPDQPPVQSGHDGVEWHYTVRVLDLTGELRCENDPRIYVIDD